MRIPDQQVAAVGAVDSFFFLFFFVLLSMQFPPPEVSVIQDGVALLPGDAGEFPKQQQEPRVPRALCQGALGGLELRRPPPRFRILRQDGERVCAGERPPGESPAPLASMLMLTLAMPHRVQWMILDARWVGCFSF